MILLLLFSYKIKWNDNLQEAKPRICVYFSCRQVFRNACKFDERFIPIRQIHKRTANIFKIAGI